MTGHDRSQSRVCGASRRCGHAGRPQFDASRRGKICLVHRILAQILLMVVAGWVLSVPVSAQVDAAWLGEWRLNLTRSSYDPGPAPYVRASYQVERHGDGIRVVYEMVRPRGGVTHLEWTGRFDGQDYAVQGVEEPVTYAYRRIDARTYDVATKVDGQPAATSRAALSADGRSITTTTTGRDGRGTEVTTVTVYEKSGH